MSRAKKIEVPDFLLKDEVVSEKEYKKLVREISVLKSFLCNDYIQRYGLCTFVISNNYLLTDPMDYEDLSRYQKIRHMLTDENSKAYAICEFGGDRYKLYDPLLAYDVASGLNQKNKRLKISYLRTGEKVRYYDGENLFILYKAGGGKYRKLNK